MPDFWCKELGSANNRVTPSGFFWEWQDPRTPVADIVLQKNNQREWRDLSIETVTISGEYGVVVVWSETGAECGMPIGESTYPPS